MTIALIATFIGFDLAAAGMGNYLDTRNVFRCKRENICYPWLLGIGMGSFATFVMWIAMNMPKAG